MRLFEKSRRFYSLVFFFTGIILSNCHDSQDYSIQDFYRLAENKSSDSAIYIGVYLLENSKVNFGEFSTLLSYIKENTGNDQTNLAEYGFKLAQNKDDSISVYLNLMGDHFLENRIDRAENCAKSILALDDNHSSDHLPKFEAYYMLGLVHEKRNEKELAVDSYLKAISIGRLSQDSCSLLHGIYFNLVDLGTKTSDTILIGSFTSLEENCRPLDK